MDNNAPTQDLLSGIYQFRRINNHLGTSGQPTPGQFVAIQQAGFEAVFNLALPTSDHALPNEGAIVTGLGMAYVHIPVSFQAPRPLDFQAFCGLMEAWRGRSVFVHCAANMRVSAFIFIYRVLYQNLSVSEASADLQAIWEPDEIWSRFIQDELQQGLRSPAS